MSENRRDNAENHNPEVSYADAASLSIVGGFAIRVSEGEEAKVHEKTHYEDTDIVVRDEKNHETLEKEKLLSLDIAVSLIDAGMGRAVANFADKFRTEDHLEIADRLIDAGEGHAVVKYIKRFQGLDHDQIAFRLIETGQSLLVIADLNKSSKFNLTKKEEIINRVIDAGDVRTLSLWIRDFTGLSQATLDRIARS